MHYKLKIKYFICLVSTLKSINSNQLTTSSLLDRFVIRKWVILCAVRYRFLDYHQNNLNDTGGEVEPKIIGEVISKSVLN